MIAAKRWTSLFMTQDLKSHGPSDSPLIKPIDFAPNYCNPLRQSEEKLWRGTYCWWKKSGQSVDMGKYPISYKVSWMLGAGFLPSTVLQESSYEMYLRCYLDIPFHIQCSLNAAIRRHLVPSPLSGMPKLPNPTNHPGELHCLEAIPFSKFEVNYMGVS